MEKKNKNILFQLVIHNQDPKQEKKYTIIDKKPCFSNLSTKEKRDFIKLEIQKIKNMISEEYKTRSLKQSGNHSSNLVNNSV